ncbi:MAG: outer-membrane lipoprotein carrier protein LolA [Gammaproteobacteria bacterium]|nr:outer-membrane lipoprotein carrier protein LolA [Gammaproteobacteria bacterium]
MFSSTWLKKFACSTAFVLFAPLGWIAQQENEVNQFQAELAKKLLAIETFQAKFSQIALTKDGETELSQSGRLLFDRSGKFLWEVTQPFEQYILVNEDTMRVFDPDLEQLTISAFESESQASFAGLILTSSTEILDDFDIEFEDNQYTLLPNKQGQDFARLKIIFENDTLDVIEILDHFDTVNRFKFTSVETNKPIASEQFELDIPEDTEIVDQRPKPHDEDIDQDD